MPPPTAQAGSGAESIYNLLPKSCSALSTKPPLYRSPRLRQAARQPPVVSTIGTFGTAHLLGQARLERRAWANWGPAGSQAADPKRFLRRGEGRKAQQAQGATTTTPTTDTSTSQLFQPRGTETRKPLVPSHVCPSSSGGTDRLVYDHIYANAMDAITATPPPPPEPDMDYLRKPNYGQVPAYLAAVKEEIRREDAILQRFLQRQQQQQQRRQGSAHGSGQDEVEGKLAGVVGPLAEAERWALVDRVKAKWDAVNAAYQKTAHHGGRHRLSGGARQRKEAQERALQQLEADIELLERGGTAGGIYIRYNDAGRSKQGGGPDPDAKARKGTGTGAA